MRSAHREGSSVRIRLSRRLFPAAAPLIGGVALCCATAAHAGLPLATDDAAVVEPHTCQLEGWVQSAHDGHQYTLAPACNPFGNLELGAAVARVDSDGGDRSSQFQLQAKTVLVPRNDGAWSFGAEAGAQRDTGAAHGRSAFQTWYLKGLATFHPSDDVELDMNLGGIKTYGNSTTLFAAAAVQYSPVERLQLLAEIFRDEPGRAKYQAGIRYVLVPDRLEAYVSYGSRFGGNSNDWWSIAGFRLQSDAFLGTR